MTVAVTFEKM